MNILSLGMPLGDAAITAVLGYAVVFVGLILLMLVVTLIGKVFTAKAAKAAIFELSTAQAAAADDDGLLAGEIGRASCRERVLFLV